MPIGLSARVQAGHQASSEERAEVCSLSCLLVYINGPVDLTFKPSENVAIARFLVKSSSSILLVCSAVSSEGCSLPNGRFKVLLLCMRAVVLLVEIFSV